MAEFSSCYFCGAALDAPLDEYPVVPAELHPSPEQQGTVVLCPTCREKLGAIVGEVVAAVETDSSLEGRQTTETTLEAATEGATPSTDAGSAPTDDEPESDDGAIPGETTEAEATTDPSDSAEGDESSDAPTPIFDDESPDGSDESDPYGPVFEDAEGGSTPDEETDDETDENPEPTPDEAESSTGTADRSAGSSGAMPDARTYNRVVRLLQNREFPVERDEIEAVATNAYELSHEEFDGVIRVAIDRGVLEEEDGKLVLPGSGE